MTKEHDLTPEFEDNREPSVEEGHYDGDNASVDDIVFGYDIALASIIEDIRNFKDTKNKVAIIEFMEALERRLEDNDWAGSVVRVSGTLRLADWADEDVGFEIFGDQIKTMRRGIDKDGEYLIANGLRVGMSIFETDITIDDDEHDDTGEGALKDEGPKTLEVDTRCVFTFDTPERIREAYVDNDQIYESGSFFMHPDDVIKIEFYRPSLDMVAHTLKTEYPDIAAMLRLDSEDAPYSDRELLANLKTIRFGRDIDIPPVILQGIGRLINREWCIDNYATYRLITSDTIYGVTEENSLETKAIKPGTKIYGDITTIDMLLEGNEYVPYLVMAEQAADSDGYEAVAVPVPNIEKLTKLRAKSQRFGKTAMLGFDSPEALYGYWLRFQEGELLQLDRMEAKQLAVNEFKEFEAQFATLMEPRIDKKRKMAIQPINTEINNLLTAYRNHVRALDHDGVLQDSQTIDQLMIEALVDTPELSIEDMLEVTGGAEIRYITPHTIEISRLGSAIILRGKFIGIAEAVFPTNPRAKQSEAAYMTIALRDAEVSDSKVSYADGIVLVKIAQAEYPSIAKLLPIDDRATS